MQNFLPLRREIRDHWVYKDNDYFKVWVDILFCARFSEEPKTDIFKGTIYTINYSEFLYSRPSFSLRLNVAESKLRKLMDNLIKDNMIEKVISLGKNKATVYRVINYEKYNFSPSECVAIEGLGANTHQVTTKSQPSGDQLTTKSQPLKKNVKKEKSEIKKDCKEDIYIKCQHLSLTKTEYEKLIETYNEIKVKDKLEYAENYSKLKNYNSLYLTLNNWLKADAKKTKESEVVGNGTDKNYTGSNKKFTKDLWSTDADND